jgi:hypothetical protein
MGLENGLRTVKIRQTVEIGNEEKKKKRHFAEMGDPEDARVERSLTESRHSEASFSALWAERPLGSPG